MGWDSHGHSFTVSLLAFLVSGFLYGCATTGRQSVQGDAGTVALTTGSRGKACCALANGVPRQVDLARTAVGLVGRSRIQLGGRRYTSDCSGLVRAVFATQKVDVYNGLGELDGGNGVGRIYTHVVEHGRIHYGP